MRRHFCDPTFAAVADAEYAGAGKTAAALVLAADVGFDVLECGMEGSFTWEQRQVIPHSRTTLHAHMHSVPGRLRQLACCSPHQIPRRHPTRRQVLVASLIMTVLFCPHHFPDASHPPPHALISQSSTTFLNREVANHPAMMTFK